MKRLMAAALLVLTGLCASCAALPAEERAFAVVLGVGRNGSQWETHARIPTYQTGGGYMTVSAAGETLSAALSALDDTAPMHLHLGQLRMVVFSRELAQSPDFMTALTELSDRQELRLQAAAAVADADLNALLEAMKPATGARLSKSLDVLLDTRIAQGVIMPSQLADVIRMGERQSPVLAAVTLDGQQVDVSGGYPVSQTGQAGELLSARDIQLLSMMTGQMSSGTLSLPEGTVRIIAASSETELTMPAMQSATARLTLRCDDADMTQEEVSRAVASACLSVLNKLADANCDALGLGRQAIRHMTTMTEWHELDWITRYPQIEWAVSVGAQPAA